ncbi:hypothetical protein SALBM135S_09627 [Streptomyces alboniger]
MPSLVIGLLLLPVHLAGEIALAREIGAQYGHGYTLFSQSGRGFRRAWRPRGAGFGCLVILFGVPALFVLIFIPALAYVPLLMLHLRSVSRRRALWKNQYAGTYARVVTQR